MANMNTFLEDVLRGGVNIVQLRDKTLNDKELIEAAFEMKAICKRYGALFIVNDRPDIALHVDADGVHVGQEDIPPSVCRKILGENKIVGLSTHSLEDFSSSINEPIDYISAGPVVETPTKPNRPGTGIDYIRYIADTCKIPWYLTGDVNIETVDGYIDAGASRFVVVRYLTNSANPKNDASKLLEHIDRSHRPQ